MSEIQLAISPLTWSNDDMPALGGHIDLETCLFEMRQAGFTGTEMGAKYPRDPQALVPLLRANGLKLASGWCSGNLLQHDVEAEWRAIAPHVALMRATGVKAMVYGEVSNTVHGDINKPLSSRPRLSDDEFSRYGKRLTALADRLMSEEGIRLAFHHHVGTSRPTVTSPGSWKPARSCPASTSSSTRRRRARATPAAGRAAICWWDVGLPEVTHSAERRRAVAEWTKGRERQRRGV